MVRRASARRLAFGALAFAAFLALGFAVSHRPPSAFDLLAQGERARFPWLALALTRAGLFPAYVTICTLALAIGIVRRAALPAAAILALEMLATWFASDAFKAFFGRARPDDYYSIHETSASYASGHAALAVACYGFLVYAAWRAPIAPSAKRALAIAAGVWVLAIGWSRLALGAHYPTDLIGGYLLGAAALALATSAYDDVVARVGRPATLRASDA